MKRHEIPTKLTAVTCEHCGECIGVDPNIALADLEQLAIEHRDWLCTARPYLEPPFT